MKKLLPIFLLLTLSFAFSACGDSDEKEDKHTTALKEELRTLDEWIKETEDLIAEKETYCARFPTNREQLACVAEWVAPLLKSLTNYKERKERIEKELGIK
jgi:hypothetical protein